MGAGPDGVAGMNPLPQPDSNTVDNAIAQALQQQYGFVPLSVRYEAASAARAVVERWRER